MLREIFNLLSFYGQDDPYQILVKGDKGLKKARKEYVKKGSYSRVTTYTPIEFLNWILEQPEYNDITSMYMKKTERDVYVPLSFTTTIQTYDDMFKHAKLGRKQAIDLVNKCVTSDSSYIMSKYSLFVLNGYNNKLESKKLRLNIRKIREDIKTSRTKMIKNDYKMMMEYKNIQLPNIIKIHDDSKRILNIKINSNRIKTQKNSVLKLIERYFTNTMFFTEILPYLQFMYTIKEIKLEKIYNKFLSSFESSSHYKIYAQHHTITERTFRWCHVLIDSYI